MTEVANLNTRAPSPASERMRLHRKRRRRGFRHVGILLHATEIQALVRKGFLEADQRESTEAVQNAICDLVAGALNDLA
jgi:hypothetical protein